jgi:hypothetical protein
MEAMVTAVPTPCQRPTGFAGGEPPHDEVHPGGDEAALALGRSKANRVISRRERDNEPEIEQTDDEYCGNGTELVDT